MLDGSIGLPSPPGGDNGPSDKLDCFGLQRKKLGLDKQVKLFILDQFCHLGLMAPHSQRM